MGGVGEELSAEGPHLECSIRLNHWGSGGELYHKVIPTGGSLAGLLTPYQSDIGCGLYLGWEGEV